VIESIPEIHEGEQAAISLATELKADLLLIDEMDGRTATLARNLPLDHISDAFARIKKTDFWISPRLLDSELDSFRQQQRERQR
jgi:predicted nucleic acid-binding protein